MYLADFEGKINATILQRGINYFNDELVEGLEETQTGVWQAFVEGTELYDVEVVLNEKSIRHWFCNCPYDGPICKHVVATLFSIREQIENPAIENSASTKQEQLDIVLEKLSHEELITFTRQLISNDRMLLDKTLLHFQAHLKDKQTAAASYPSLFKDIIRRNSSRGFIDYRSAQGFSHDTWELLKNLDSSNIPATDRVESCYKILEILMKKVVNSIDDSNGDLANICMDIADILMRAYPELTNEQQIACFDKMLFWEFESELDEYGLAQYLNGLAPSWAGNNTDFQGRYLQKIDKMLSTSRSDWQEESLKIQKQKQLSVWGRAEEADSFASENMGIPEIRGILVDKAIQEKHYEMAQSLIHTGIALAKKKKHPGVVADWREKLLDIAKQTNDIDATRTLLMDMLESSWFEIEQYRQLKASYQADEWLTVRTEYINKIKNRYNDSYVMASIYAEENQPRQLFDLIQADEYRASSLFKQYLKILAKEFPEESSNFYAIIIQHELEQSGRKVYQQAVRDIKALQKLYMGEAIASQLIGEVTQKYANRPAMLELFKKAFGEVD